MNVLFDTNVILDAVLGRNDYAAAQALLMAVANERIRGIVTANSLTDIYYVAKKLLDEKDVRKAVSNILSVFEIAAVDGEACSDALDVTEITDFEDALVVVCARREDAGYIATSDRKFIAAGLDNPCVMTPREVLARIEQS